MKNSDLIKKIKTHPQNSEMTAKGWRPLFTADPLAKVVIIGQAPGAQAQSADRPWADKSGEQLRRWLGVTEEEFYNPQIFSLMPMDFYFPGKGKSGDLPPRRGFADTWHPQLLGMMPNIELKILIGQYPQKYYLPDNKHNLTDTVKSYKEYIHKGFFPLPHPSPRNNIWKAKNPWFEEEVVPSLRKSIKQAII